MAAARILCIGSRLAAGDDIGPRVHDRLAGIGVPPGVALIDGGLRGLDLLRCLDGPGLVVVVDTLEGFGEAGRTVELAPEAVMAEDDGGFGHAAGLPYLLRAWQATAEPPLPRLVVVGCGAGADEAALVALADRCLVLAACEARS